MAAELRRESTDKRQAILDAALDLFAERGFHGTAVPQIAERAGVGAGTLYRYFENKEALVNALYQGLKATLAASLLEGFPIGAPVRAQFSQCWRRLSSFALAQPKAFIFLELHHHQPYLDARSRAMDDRVLGPIRAFVVQAQREQALKELEPELLMSIVYGGLVGVVRAGEAGYIAKDRLESALEKTEACIWEAIRR